MSPPAPPGLPAGWTLVNLSASYARNMGPRDALRFVKLQNAGNKLAYGASSMARCVPCHPCRGAA